jgi:hypothetical protein
MLFPRSMFGLERKISGFAGIQQPSYPVFIQDLYSRCIDLPQQENRPF